MAISKKIRAAIEGSSWIRRMFEEGAELKARLGADQVCDFTLGNPDLEPPPAFKIALWEAVQDPQPGLHRYMPNAGLLASRQQVARYLEELHGLPFTADNLIMTCGAAGGLNVILKALLDTGDEVIILAPFFPEYLYYIDNHAGICRVVETDDHFRIDLQALEAALSPRTRAVLINSPNNPTGQIYDQASLQAVGQLLADHSQRYGHPIYLINDEPYRRLVYDGLLLPSVFAAYPHTLVATSFSKDLCLPGERIGYVAVSPQAQDRQELVTAMILANRILGFVNAPALMQRVVAQLTHQGVDLKIYAERRELFCQILNQAGYDLVKPQGAFYLFPRSPIPDDGAFIQELKQENILAVPGRGFGRSGYFRLAFCVPQSVIERAAPGFARARARVA
ncbi:MAG: pyridoxal phosphate-dependent aminotransferase [Deltaproteobacteria bacterium]|nr:pyridoxal phosphate-dependent aminotransferase [Deltaproteobacteria bacterium]MBW1952904.1 pyridoxal phosphate-dependent aminotransferase [Deltaproteobacteria bacterium]MBW1987138.1 pyridoxal phosphate-dependent aminotransferase [Deltaproteobacteria bacterium]MBW2135350.1 pyridoxal phosphate-dependent aminotransferase [Deltaproteobacteria bacterium]